MDNISIDIYLQKPSKMERRIKLQHILAAAVMLLMGVAFIFYEYPLLRLIGIISVASSLLVFYFCLPSMTDRMVVTNRSLRIIEIGTFIILGIGFLISMRYMNFIFMLAMAAAFGVLLYTELQTSMVRRLIFSDQGLEFTSLQKHFYFAPHEIKNVHVGDKNITIKFSDDKFLKLMLAQKVSEKDKELLEKEYNK